MNGISIPLREKITADDQRVVDLLNFANFSVRLSDWGILQARQLFESVPEWEKEPYVKQSVWEKKFKISAVKAMTRSEQVFKDYLRINSFEELGR
jgi:hypothetical protein